MEFWREWSVVVVSGLCQDPGGLLDVGALWPFPNATSASRLRPKIVPQNVSPGRIHGLRHISQLDGNPGPQNTVAVATNPLEDDPHAH